jgi:phosphate-selective porin OprO/OprP
MRNLAGGDGRNSIQLTYTIGSTFLSLAYTGDKVQEVTPVFDEQQAIVARAAYSDLVLPKTRIVLSAAATDIFRLPDATSAGNSPRSITLANPPELDVDDNSSKLVSISVQDAASVTAFNGESALQVGSVLVQGGAYRYVVSLRNLTTSAHRFSGWYTEGSWMLTGQPRLWSGSTASFRGPELNTAKAPLLTGGALELGARYSFLTLDDLNADMAVAHPPAFGGTQRVATAGLNWYVNSSVKLSLQLQDVRIKRTSSLFVSAGALPSLNQEFKTIAVRTQFAL